MRLRIATLMTVGLALLAFGGLTILEIPGQLAEYDREPEDAWAVAIYSVLLAIGSFTFLGAAAVLVKPSVLWLSRPIAICAGLLLVLGGIAVGFLALAPAPPGVPPDPVTWIVALLLVGLPLLPLHTVLRTAPRLARARHAA